MFTYTLINSNSSDDVCYKGMIVSHLIESTPNQKMLLQQERIKLLHNMKQFSDR